jgi:peptide/nickel transport system substrate-binding protein
MEETMRVPQLLRLIVSLVVIAMLAACGAAATPEAEPTSAPESAASPAAETEASPESEPAESPEAEPTAVTEPEPATGGSVSRALTSEPTGLDPGGSFGSGQNILLPYIFDTLVIFDFDNQVRPLLAESYEVAEDGLSVTFTLKEGIVFHDGTPLDAAAVAFTFNRLLDPEQKSPMAGSLANVAAVEAVDGVTVRFDFNTPDATFFATLTSPYAGIVSPTAVEAAGADFSQNPVGSGPFKLKEWDTGVAITLERNPDYAWAAPISMHSGAPYIDEAVFKVIPDAATQIAALQAGELDVVFINQPDDMERLAENENVTLLPVSLNSLAYVGFNTARAPVDDVLVRQALSHAIDKDAIVATALGGRGETAFAPMSKTLLGFDESLKELELGYDPERSAALLAEAGYTQNGDGQWEKDGEVLALTLLTFTRAPNEDVVTVLQSQFKSIGIDATIQQFDAPTAGKMAVDGEYDVLFWRYDWNAPTVLNTYLHSNRIGRTNRFFYSNPEVDALLDQANSAVEDAERAQIYLDAQRLIMQDAVWQPIYTPVDMLAVNARMQDVVIGSMGRVVLNDVTLAE